MSLFNKPRDAGATPPGRPLEEPRASLPETVPTTPSSQGGEPPPAKRPQSAASVLGADLLIKGGIEGRGDIQLHGRAWGDVKVERLLVTETAELEGSVEAVVVEVRGRVLGPITARYVKLSRGCQVQGDITYESLAIEEGATFEGACRMSKAARAAAKQAQQASQPAPQGPSAPGGPSAKPTAETSASATAAEA